MVKSEVEAVKLPKTIVGMYAEVCKCSNGYYNVRLNRKWGYVNENGNVIIPVKYDAPADFDETGKALVRRDREYIYITETGEEHEV
ncbi:MAG: WG repeat-containing protein [Clostridia bacterium]|nr:WG repeat-containing protein [Clostridia bacterium]